MPIGCLISFDNNPQGVYYAGQELSGTVDFNVDINKRIKAIHITVNGYAKIRWIKKGYPSDSERATCRAYRSYLSSRSYVLGSVTGSSSSIIDWLAGEYTYSFHVILPDNLPTSFDGKYGQIHYEIIATIDRPSRYPKVYRLPFTVIHPLDLNFDPIYRVPLDILDRKTFWSFCCPTGPLTVKFSTPYCGYAAGQKINFILFVNNESSIDITECFVKLKQEVSYESIDPQHEYRYDKNLIAMKKFGSVLRWSRKVYRGSLDLPSIPPTNVMSGCPIAITYAIKIIIKPTEFHFKLKLKIPVTIGSIPIMESHIIDNEEREANRRRTRYPRPPPLIVTDSNLHSNHVNIHSLQGNGSDENMDNPPEYIPMVPPSYEDAMALCDKFIDDIEYLHSAASTASLDSTHRVFDFKPRYPVYYNFTTPTVPPDQIIDGSPTQISLPSEVEDVK